MTPIHHARAGLKVLVLARTNGDAAKLFDAILADFREDPPTDVDRVIRVNGGQRIDFRTGGSIRFYSRHGGTTRIRGAQADVVYLDDHRPILDPVFMADLAPVFSARGDVRIGVIA